MDPDAAENSHLETSLRSWLSSHLPAHAASLNDENTSLHDVLKSGVILCEMMNIIKPGSMKRISMISTAYKQLENVQNYLNMCKIMGMQASQLFESSDLVNGKFKSSILINLKTLQGIYDRFSKSTPTITSSPSSSSLSTSTSSTSLASSKSISTPSQPVVSSTSPAKIASSPSSGSLVRNSSQNSVNSLSSESTGASKANVPAPDVIRTVVNTKPDEKTVALVQRWIEVVLTMRTPAGKTLFDWLKSGVILLRVLNVIKPDICRVIYEGNIGFKQIENVQRYLKLCPIAVGPAVPLFSVADLTDESDLSAVTSHLHAMITLVQRDSKWNGPTLESAHHDIKLESVSSHSSQSSETTPLTTSTSSPTQLSPSTSLSSETRNDTHQNSIQTNPIPPASSNETEPSKSIPELVESSSTSFSSLKSETKAVATEEIPVHHQSPSQRSPSSSNIAITSSTSSSSVSQSEVTTSETETTRRQEAQIPNEPSGVASHSSLACVAAKVDDEHMSEIERARKELEAERLAMQEERRIFAEQMQAETERRLREMALKLEEETAAVIAKERRRSVAMNAMLEEERREREKIAVQLEEERKSRKMILEESDRQKEALSIQAQKQMQLVADRLQEETTKRLEAMASKITSDAMQKAEQELRKKDEHLMKQLDRERMLRSRLDALEEEKKSLSRTFERKFAALETELKAVKTAPKGSSSVPQGTTMLVVPTITTTLDSDSDTPVSPSNPSVDPLTIKEFKEWNSKWRSNRMMTKQLTRTLTELSSARASPSLPSAADDSESDSNIDGTTSEARGEHSEFVLHQLDEDRENAPLSLITPRSEIDLGSEADDEPLNLDLDRKQWLDDDWSEEEDWEEEYDDDDDDFDDQNDSSVDLIRREENHEEDSLTPRLDSSIAKHTSGRDDPESDPAKKSPVSPSKDEWSQFSGMNLSRFS